LSSRNRPRPGKPSASSGIRAIGKQLRHSPAKLSDAEIRGVASRMHHGSSDGIDKDWAISLGTGATAGATNYPAKFAFQGTSATCAGGLTQADFVVYGTGRAGTTSQASIAAFDNLYSGCVADGTVPTAYWGL
jgi:hypothetical protein